MTHLTSDRGSPRRDDRVDALAMAVAYWVDQMTGEAQRGYAYKVLNAELDRFHRHVLRDRPKPPASARSR